MPSKKSLKAVTHNFLKNKRLVHALLYAAKENTPPRNRNRGNSLSWEAETMIGPRHYKPDQVRGRRHLTLETFYPFFP
jgi:hypothetical protein